MISSDIHDTLHALRRQFPTGVTTHSLCSRCKTIPARGTGPCTSCLEDELRQQFCVPDELIKRLFDANSAARVALFELDAAQEAVVAASSHNTTCPQNC